MIGDLDLDRLVRGEGGGDGAGSEVGGGVEVGCGRDEEGAKVMEGGAEGREGGVEVGGGSTVTEEGGAGLGD